MDQVMHFCNKMLYFFNISLDPTLYYNAKFGEGNGPVVWNNIACSGWESTIQSCSKQVYPSFTCPQQYTAGMTCKDSKCCFYKQNYQIIVKEQNFQSLFYSL